MNLVPYPVLMQRPRFALVHYMAIVNGQMSVILARELLELLTDQEVVQELELQQKLAELNKNQIHENHQTGHQLVLFTC